jgi:hypothetical protein
MRYNRALLSITCAFVWVAASPLAAQEYEFVKIADSTDLELDPFEFGRATINARGDVAFRAADLNFQEIIFRGDGQTLVIITDENQTPGFIGRHPDINDAGQVSFAVNISGPGEKLFRGDGVTLTTIAGTDPDLNGDFNFFGFDTSINNLGFVAFSAELDNFDLGVFTGSGGAANTIFTSGDGQFDGSFDRPAINDAGQVVFFTFLPDGESALYRADGSNVFTLIADTTGDFGDFTAPDMNASGEVAFLTRHDDFSTAEIYVGDGATLTLIADNLSDFDDLDPPSINDDGDVAFRAFYPTGGTSDPFFEGGILINEQVVVETGQPLFGSTVENLILRQSALNNSDEVAFTAQLADGRTVVARGTPGAQSTPAPLTDFTVAFGTLLSGTLADLVESDDFRVRIRSRFGFTAGEANVLELRIGAMTTAQNSLALDITVEGRLNQTGGTSKLRLRNWSTNAFQLVHQYPIGSAEIVETIEGVDATNRVRITDGRIELSIRQSVLVTFSASGFISGTDQVVISVR